MMGEPSWRRRVTAHLPSSPAHRTTHTHRTSALRPHLYTIPCPHYTTLPGLDGHTAQFTFYLPSPVHATWRRTWFHGLVATLHLFRFTTHDSGFPHTPHGSHTTTRAHTHHPHPHTHTPTHPTYTPTDSATCHGQCRCRTPACHTTRTPHCTLHYHTRLPRIPLHMPTGLLHCLTHTRFHYSSPLPTPPPTPHTHTPITVEERVPPHNTDTTHLPVGAATSTTTPHTCAHARLYTHLHTTTTTHMHLGSPAHLPPPPCLPPPLTGPRCLHCLPPTAPTRHHAYLAHTPTTYHRLPPTTGRTTGYPVPHAPCPTRFCTAPHLPCPAVACRLDTARTFTCLPLYTTLPRLHATAPLHTTFCLVCQPHPSCMPATPVSLPSWI